MQYDSATSAMKTVFLICNCQDSSYLLILLYCATRINVTCLTEFVQVGYVPSACSLGEQELLFTLLFLNRKEHRKLISSRLLLTDRIPICRISECHIMRRREGKVMLTQADQCFHSSFPEISFQNLLPELSELGRQRKT